MTPTVSVCMPVYRSERFVAESIHSVLAQTFKDFELIVVDDASPDSTYEIASTIRDPRLRVTRNERNLGPEGNWNRALGMASGRYIKLLPGDDTLYPTCLERQVAVLEDERNRGVVLVYCARDVVDAAGRKVMRARFPGAGRMAAASLLRRTVRYGTNIIGEPGAVLFRRDAALRCGGFDATYGYVIDLDYWLRLLRHGDAYAIDEALCTFRLSGENWSTALGLERCRQYLGFLDRLAERDARLRGRDLWAGRVMARINERLRRLVYRRLIGLTPGTFMGN